MTQQLKMLTEEAIPQILDIDKHDEYKDKGIYAPIKGKGRKIFEQTLKNLQEYVNEGTFSADISKFVPKLIPVYRRIFPFLLPQDLVGTQPMDKPSSLLFALRYHYTNDGANPIDMNATATQTSSQILLVTDLSQFAVGDAIVSSGGAVGVVRYTEDKVMGKVMLVDVTSGTFAAAETIDDADPYVTAAATITTVYDNEAGYNTFLQNYSGPISTASAEALSTNMKEVGLTIDQKTVTAEERWLKAKYSMSAAQDLKNVHGMDMDEELSNIMAYEVAQSINRQIIDAINDNAAVSTFDLSSDADGRWQAEKFRTLYIELVRKSNLIAVDTRRGPGNFIIASYDAITALESLSSFQYAPVNGDVNTAQFDSAYAGSLGARFKLYRDTFATTDYATVGYKGVSEFDAGVMYSPYVPIQVYRGLGEEDAKPRIFFQTRDAVTTSIFGTSNYYKKVSISNLF